jgi:ATP-dependent Clp protease ATP-binding subunit ClpA
MSFLDDRVNVNNLSGLRPLFYPIYFNEALTQTLPYIHVFFLTQSLLTIFIIVCTGLYSKNKSSQNNKPSRIYSSSSEVRKRDFKKISQWLEQNILGQTNAIRECLGQIYNRVYSNRKDVNLGSYLLIGPAGTGKNFFSKLLSEGLFGAKSILPISFNKSNQTPVEILNLIFNAISEKDSLVIFLEEIDKAQPEVSTILTEFIKTRKLQNPKTQEWVQCSSMVIIATTNKNQTSAAINTAIFDGIFYFSQLSPEDTVKIAFKQLKKYYSQENIQVNFLSTELVSKIVKEKRSTQEFGVKQLLLEIRHQINPIIFEAKNNGASEVEILYINNQFIAKQKISDLECKSAA